MIAYRKMQIDPQISPCTKFNSNGSRASIRLETLTLKVKKVETSFEVIGIGKRFVNRTLKADTKTNN